MEEPMYTPNDCLNKNITIEEICLVVEQAVSQSAYGYDNIPFGVLKFPPVISVLHQLFQLIFDSSLIPSIWRKAIICPIHKDPASDPRVPMNYRGVSLLSCASKLYSAFMNKRLTHYLENSELLADEQNGFRKNRSCEEHVFTLSSIVRNNSTVFGAFIDLRKCFDFINREMMLYKLLLNGIDGKLHKSIRNIYQHSSSCVRINDKLTERFDCKSGAKQEDNLSSTLFSIFINDLVKEINDLNIGFDIGGKKISTLLYADDIVLLAKECVFRECEIQPNKTVAEAEHHIFQTSDTRDEYDSKLISYFEDEIRKLSQQQRQQIVSLLRLQHQQSHLKVRKSLLIYYRSVIVRIIFQQLLVGSKQHSIERVESQPLFNPHDAYLFNKALVEGQERDLFVRINVVGYFAQGKTSLIRRLLNKPIDGVVSTDGIDVHIRKCKIKDAAVWESYETPLDEDCNRRLAKVAKSNDMKTMKTRVMKPGEKGEYSGIETNLTQTKETPGSLQDQATSLNFHEQDVPLLVKKLLQEINIKDIESESDFFANIWDFGGQYIYYATHQIFHSRDAIYLLVFDLRQDLESLVIDNDFPERRQKIKNCLKFWVNSIDTFVGTNDGKQPLIIFVGTHKDKFDGDIDDKFGKVIDLFVNTKARNHIYKTPFAVSNVDATDKSIGELREAICEIAKQHFAHRKVPAKWIPLEKALLSTRKEKNILTFQDVMELAKTNMISAQDEEDIKLFLKYHHAKGTLIFFDEDALDKYVIATPRYLIDAFKCIFTSKDVCKWNRDLHPLWKKLETTAVLERGLVNEVWKCDQSNDFIDNADILLMFLQRHRIISELLLFDNTTETVKGLGKYLVPSMLRQQCDEEHLKAFIGRKHGSVVSLGFKLEHNSVLENIYVRITAAALGRWPPIKYNGENFLFKNIGFYRLDRQHIGQIALKDEKGLELTVYNLCAPNKVEKKVCDRFRRYIESMISYDIKRPHGDLNTKPYGYYFTCNHREHGGYGSKEVVNQEDMESLISVSCPDYLDHSVATCSAREEWFLNETTAKDQTIPDRRVTDKDLKRLSESIGKNWMLLGVELGFSMDEIERLEIDYAVSGVATSIFYMLFEWSERNSHTATFNVLIKAMKECEQLSVNWDKIRNIIDEF
ncbi:uncharacterized protein LOC128551032 [Mercenaria mercenaria]|uniref:uncharacterized protein LOC128551032 n=1 Tax=Mercenaria mercenaria TaxID=6596 RepID=UPI00234F6B11|nr:uncharacterized protein LOC128551032 [Mercenaria mercenaria]